MMTRSEINLRYAENNRDKLNAAGLRYRLANPEKYLWRAAKNRATKRGIPFEIDIGDILIPPACPVLGIALQYHVGKSGGRDSSPSIDRLDPNLGYLKGNIQVISNKANMMKSSATPDELKLFAEWVNKTYD